MIKMFRNFTKKDWGIIFLSFALIVLQVLLDLKLPDYMSSITTLIQSEGSEISDILLQGFLMLLCAFGSLLSAILVGYFSSNLAANFSLNF